MVATFYLVVRQDDLPAHERNGCVQVRLVTPSKDYIGLRVTPEEGMQRYRQTFGDKVPTFELIILESRSNGEMTSQAQIDTQH